VDAAHLQALDSEAPTVLEAIAHVRAPPAASLATPHLFVTSLGTACWVKAQSQHGLSSELIAGRLASRVDAGPPAHVVRVPREALPADGSANHLQGTLVGSEDIDGAVNNRELHLFGVQQLDPARIDPAQLARVVVFQTWVGLGDLQAIVQLTTGKVYSHDHGECFGSLADVPPTLNVLDLPGLDRRHGSAGTLVAAAVARVQSITDDELLQAVARVPDGPEWNSDVARRLRIAEWLAGRRAQLPGVMASW
jgi:hypothetical protein